MAGSFRASPFSGGHAESIIDSRDARQAKWGFIAEWPSAARIDRCEKSPRQVNLWSPNARILDRGRQRAWPGRSPGRSAPDGSRPSASRPGRSDSAREPRARRRARPGINAAPYRAGQRTRALRRPRLFRLVRCDVFVTGARLDLCRWALRRPQLGTKGPSMPGPVKGGPCPSDHG